MSPVVVTVCVTFVATVVGVCVLPVAATLVVALALTRCFIMPEVDSSDPFKSITPGHSHFTFDILAAVVSGLGRLLISLKYSSFLLYFL